MHDFHASLNNFPLFDFLNPKLFKIFFLSLQEDQLSISVSYHFKLVRPNEPAQPIQPIQPDPKLTRILDPEDQPDLT